MIRALVFDFDGLILDTETPLIDAYGEMYAAQGLAFDREQFIRHVGHADYSFDPWAPFPATADRAALEEERRRRNREILVHQPVLPGVLSLLDAARDAGLKLAMASNSSHDWVEGHLSRLGLHDRFSFFACRGDTPSPKPEPDLYRLAVNQLGARSHEAIAFEDSASGTLAARRAGLWVVAVPNPCTHEHDLGSAHLRIDSLANVTLDDLRRRFEQNHLQDNAL